jgi:mannose-1-phosphate guanylyltransferase/mannose-6-phosphate isomerase
MPQQVIKPIILCGGSGTRLWPLSRESLPKQFAPLIHNKSLLQTTLERVVSLGDVLCIANQEHRFFVQEAMGLAGTKGEQLLEPAGRNTAAAMACAAINAQPDDLLLFLPSDHYIPDTALFIATVRSGAAAASEGFIVTFGIHPSFPSTAYGYIEQGSAIHDSQTVFNVGRFIEKPPLEKAQQLLLSGAHLWNAGIFLCTAATLRSALKTYAADILNQCEVTMNKAERDGNFIRPDRHSFLATRSESIDYAVMEKFPKMAVVPFLGSWSDVGSWNAVADLTPADEDGNRIEGKAVLLHARNTYINAPQRPVVAIGTQDLLIIDTPDALLVAHKDHAEQVKQAVEQLKLQGIPEAQQHRRVARPWGWYDSVDIGERFQVKRIGVNPGASLSLQMHHHRAEHWIVVKGTAEVTNGERVYLVAENESTYIPLGTKHRLKNPGKTALEIIEVQSGSYLGEDDIVRFEDTYGRAN